MAARWLPTGEYRVTAAAATLCTGQTEWFSIPSVRDGRDGRGHTAH